MPRHALIEPTIYYSHNGQGGGGGGAPIVSLIKVTAASIIEVIILSSVGYILARRGIIDKKTQTKINKLNVSFFTPALLFSKVAFTLNPRRLAELFIVPIGFVIVTSVSALSAFVFSYFAGISKAQRNFAIACAISPNSNSLPVALMQSLVVTVPQLHWEEQGEPEDTVDGMLGRALTYLVLFSTLGMFLRWSVGAKLLSSAEEADEEEEEERRRLDPDAYRDDPSVADHLVDYGQHDPQGENGLAPHEPTRPLITLRRPTADFSSRSHKARQGPPAWARSFPNSPDGSTRNLNGDADSQEGDENDDDDDDDETLDIASPRLPGSSSSSPRKSFWKRFKSGARRAYKTVVVKPIRVVGSFMTAPLYAAILSLVVALISPLQKFVDSLEPLVGALETAGACSIPLTMVVLGAYFFVDTAAVTEIPKLSPSTAPAGEGPISSSSGVEASSNGLTNGNSASTKLIGARSADLLDDDEGSDVDPWRRQSLDSSTDDSTLVQKDSGRRKGLGSWMPKNPWGSAGASDIESAGPDPSSTSVPVATSDLAERNADLNSRGGAGRKAGSLSKLEEKKKRQRMMETRTIAAAICSRMLITPLILLPLVAWYAIATKYNVMDDPVFIASACLIIGSPPALTLAQITSQNANGDSSFERLISKTIFVSYAILAAPTTIALVMTALLIAENDH